VIELIVTVIVCVLFAPVNTSVAGVNAQLRPVGRAFPQFGVRVPAYPPTLATVSVTVPVWPTWMEIPAALGVTVKAGAVTTTVTGVVVETLE
jgi:hypothetical protein